MNHAYMRTWLLKYGNNQRGYENALCWLPLNTIIEKDGKYYLDDKQGKSDRSVQEGRCYKGNGETRVELKNFYSATPLIKCTIETPSDVETAQWLLNKRGPFGYNMEWQIVLYQGSLSITFNNNGSSTNPITIGLEVEPNTVYNAVFYYTGTEAVITIDDRIVSTPGEVSIVNGGLNIVAFRQSWSNGGFFKGKISNVYIGDYKTNVIHHHYKCDEQSGTTCFDSVGSAHGEIIGTIDTFHAIDNRFKSFQNEEGYALKDGVAGLIPLGLNSEPVVDNCDTVYKGRVKYMPQIKGQYEGHFDGVGHAEISGNGVYNKYSIMVKFKSEVSQTNNRPLFSQAHNAVDGSYGRPELGIHKDGFMYSTRGWNGSTYDMQVSNISVLDNKFHTGIITVDSESGVIKTYLDGILFGISDECVYPLKLEYLNVKEQCEIASRRTKGRYTNVVISNLRICNRVLTEEEIVSESFEGNVLDYDFSTGSGLTLFDKSPERNHAEIIGITEDEFWEQGEGKCTLAIEGGNWSEETGFIPSCNDNSGLDATGQPCQIKPYEFSKLPYTLTMPRCPEVIKADDKKLWTDENENPEEVTFEELESNSTNQTFTNDKQILVYDGTQVEPELTKIKNRMKI